MSERMDINQETILDALNDFERKPTEIPPILEDYLLRIARNGEIIFPWGKIKPLLKRKLEVVCDEFNATTPEEIPCHVPNFDSFHYDTLKKNILQAVDAFTSAPFTIQRLCELVTNPKKHYNRTDKYMRGIEKNVLVVSTIEPRIGVQNDSNANVNPVVNGIISDSPREDNDSFSNHENNENVSSSNLNTPANHVLLDNFANVFPTAACIPSPSNICINREIDSMNTEINTNFIPSSECVQNSDVEFEPQVSLEIPDSNEPKDDEQMDTSSEEQSCTNDSCEVTSADTQQHADAEADIDADIEAEADADIEAEAEADIEAEAEADIEAEAEADIEAEAEADMEAEAKADIEAEAEAAIEVEAETNTDIKNENEEQVSKPEVTDEEISETTSSVEDDVSASENVKSEADCSESHSADVPVIEKESLEPNQCQQDDTVSQSDNICDINDVSQSDEVCEPGEITSNGESVSENASEEVSQSTTSDSSGQCMELESSSTEEPSV